jgi:SAM-dependent methyltransferase
MILDIGCGYMIKNFNQAGKLNRLMEFINSRYIGIDPIGEWFIPIKHSNVEFHIGYGEHLPFEANVFDSVMLLGVLDHEDSINITDLLGRRMSLSPLFLKWVFTQCAWIGACVMFLFILRQKNDGF